MSLRRQSAKSENNSEIVQKSKELDLTNDAGDQDEELFELKKKIGLPGSVAIIAGTMVGSGIFASPVGVLAGTNGSVGMSLVLWAACGFIAGLAALCYAELASMIKDSGAEYAYLYRGYGSRAGPVLAFTFSWTAVVITRNTGNAATAITFGSYAVEPFFAGDCKPPEVVTKCAAAILLLVLLVINYLNVKVASKIQGVLTVAKFIGMTIIFIGGFVRLAQGDVIGLNNLQNAFHPEDLAGLGFTQIGLAFYQGLWSYDGWNNLTFISEEVKNSKRTVPLAIIIAVPLVTVFYILVNVAYFSVLTPEEMLTSDAVAVTWGYRVLGSAGWIMSLVVCLSTLGSLNGSYLTGGRLPFVAARRSHLPKILAMVTVDFYTPGPALIFTTILTLVFLIPNNFDTLVTAFSFAAWFFYALVIISVVILRFTHPDVPRPYKVPIFIPIITFAIAVYLVVAPLVDNPDLVMIFAGVFMLFGPFVFYIFVHKKLQIPGIDSLTLFLQKVLNVAPTDWEDGEM